MVQQQVPSAAGGVTSRLGCAQLRPFPQLPVWQRVNRLRCARTHTGLPTGPRLTVTSKHPVLNHASGPAWFKEGRFWVARCGPLRCRHKPEAQAKGPGSPSLALQACGDTLLPSLGPCLRAGTVQNRVFEGNSLARPWGGDTRRFAKTFATKPSLLGRATLMRNGLSLSPNALGSASVQSIS